MSGRDAGAVAAAPPPRANPALIGQDAAEGALARAFADGGRPAQAWLLTGPKGVGKATLAFRLARHLLHRPPAGGAAPSLFAPASDGPAAGPLFVDPEEPVFRRVASGGHGDLLTVEPAFDAKRGVHRTEITVDEARAVGAFLATTAAEGGWRVVIIDPAEAMNRNAANALLKTLEEPPQGAVIVLVSHAPGLLPATIRSRCRRLALPPLAEPALASLIARYCPAVAADEVPRLTRLARGSIGAALTLASGDFARIDDAMREAFAALPRPTPEAVRGLCDAAAEAGGEGFATVAAMLRGWLAAIVRAASGGPATDGMRDADAATVAALARAAPLERWLEVWDKATDALARAEPANMDRRQIVLALFLHLETVVAR